MLKVTVRKGARIERPSQVTRESSPAQETILGVQRQRAPPTANRQNQKPPSQPKEPKTPN